MAKPSDSKPETVGSSPTAPAMQRVGKRLFPPVLDTGGRRFKSSLSDQEN